MPSSQPRELKDERVGIITEVFRPLLVKVLDVRDITEHLKSHFDKDDPMFNELLENCQTSGSRIELTERLLVILEEKPDQKGLFKAFLDALKHTGYDTLMGAIEGTCEFDTKRRGPYRQLLRVFAERLELVSPASLLPHLTHHLTTRDREAIMAKINNEGELSGATELLLRLDRKSDKWFDPLVEGLEADPGSQELGRELRDMKEFITGSSRESDEDFSTDEIASGVDTYHIDSKTNEPCDDRDNGVVELVLREYQERVAEEAMKGENSLVILPTGMGKTEVAIAVIEKRFLACQRGASNAPNPKTVFVVNKVPLVKQQKDRCLQYLQGRCSVAGVSGEEMMEVPLSTVIEVNDVTVLTAQILVNALQKKESDVSLSDISFLILDECHHCQKSNPYNVLMAMYRDLKLKKPGTSRPQILGLTASPGVGRSRDKREALGHIIKLCANLDSTVARWSIVSKETHSPKEIQCIVQGRSLEDPYFRKISAVMEKIEEIILTSDEGKKLESEDGEFSKNRSRRGQQAYEQVVINLEKRIKQHVEQGDRMRELVACVSFLRGYNDSLFINRDIQTLDAIAYMERYVSEEENTQASGRMDLILIQQFRDLLPSLQTIAGMANSRNPVLDELKQQILKEYQENPDSRGIVFTRTRVSAKALAGWLNEDPQFLPLQLNADFLIGSGGSEGMSSGAQDVLLKKFRDGGHKIIVATSLAEEGLDIEACNLVFRYNYVTSDIGHVQTKGRSRAFSGKVYVIVNSNLQLQERELRNIIKVAIMEETVRKLTTINQNELLQKMLVEQKEDQKQRQKEQEMRDALKARRVQKSDVIFQCCKCLAPACEIDDIRAIKDQHHIVCNDLFLNTIDLVPVKKEQLIDGYRYKQKILCTKCQKTWGSMVVYQNTELPLIAVKNFILVDGKGKRSICKKWKDVPFQIKPVTIEDLLKQMNISPTDDDGEESDDDNVMIMYSNIMTPE